MEDFLVKFYLMLVVQTGKLLPDPIFTLFYASELKSRLARLVRLVTLKITNF